MINLYVCLRFLRLFEFSYVPLQSTAMFKTDVDFIFILDSSVNCDHVDMLFVWGFVVVVVVWGGDDEVMLNVLICQLTY